MNNINSNIQVEYDVNANYEVVDTEDLMTAPADTIYGTDQPINQVEEIQGTEGDDTIYGGSGDDAIHGNGGDDYIDATADNDNGQKTITGGDGSDKIFTNSESTVTVSGDAGNDFISHNGTGLGTLAGGDGADRIKGGLNTDTITGNDGGDFLWGRGGADSISGGNGDDIIDGGTGGDMMWGGAGDDVLLDRGNSDATQQNYVYGGDGNDTINLRLSEANNTVYGDHANDGQTLTDGSADGNDVIQTGSGADTINGGGGNDHIRAGEGNDTITGGTGNDKIWAGDGQNEVYGNEGFDYIRAGNDGGTYDAGMQSDFSDGGLIWGGNGNDTIANANKGIGGNGNDLFNNVREVHGGEGNDTVNFNGIDGSQSVVAHLGGGDDMFNGAELTQNAYVKAGSGENFIETGSGNDKIWGGSDASDDTIFGGAGNDILFSGTGGSSADGADVMVGGEGADTFVLQSFNQEGATLIDYKQGEDVGIDIGDYLDSVGYTGSDPVADGYITTGYIDDGFTNPETGQAMDVVWMSFDPTGSGTPNLNFGNVVGEDLSALELTAADFII